MQAQTTVHQVSGNTKGASLQAAPSQSGPLTGPRYHSALHIGERYWAAHGEAGHPAEDAIEPSPRLEIELDYIENSSWPGNGDPRDLTQNGVSLTEAIETNYRLYGIDVELTVDDAIDPDNLDNRCKFSIFGSSPCMTFDPDNGFNRYSLGRLETDYHDDESKLHMLYGSTLSNNSPKTLIDKETNYSEFDAQSWHTGAPDSPAVRYIEEDFGVFIGRGEYRTGDFAGLQSVTMHELGHALSVGWADDAPIPGGGPLVGQKAYEVYSGSTDPTVAGGIDTTPERILAPDDDPLTLWSLMGPGSGTDIRLLSDTTGDIPVYAFSIEERVS